MLMSVAPAGKSFKVMPFSSMSFTAFFDIFGPCRVVWRLRKILVAYPILVDYGGFGFVGAVQLHLWILPIQHRGTTYAVLYSSDQ